MPLSRRTLLMTGAAGAAGALLPTPALARPDTGVSAYPFPLTAVRLGAGPFADNAGRTQEYLRFLDADRLLHMFRVTAGLSSSATPCGGWESPATELRGHSIGHVLSALAQAYASTGEAAFKTKGDYLVAQLALCQKPSGYLSAYPESFLIVSKRGRASGRPTTRSTRSWRDCSISTSSPGTRRPGRCWSARPAGSRAETAR